MVYFCDPKNSKIDIVQAAGRALRRADHRGKKFGYIVVPIFHEKEEKLEETLENSAFKNLVNVIRAMCDQDERLQAEITRVKIGEGKRRSSNSRHIKIVDEIPLIILENFENNKLKQNLFSSIINKVPVPWRPFEEARKFVRKLNLKSNKEWRKYCRVELPGKGIRPADIPTNPQKIYKDRGWVSWGDWLGTGTVAMSKIEYQTFEQARAFAHSLNLSGKEYWYKYCRGGTIHKKKLPSDIPANPTSTYKNKGWINWGDWLGTGNIAGRDRKYRQFKQARAFIHALQLSGENEWRLYCKGKLPQKGAKPDDIPGDPRQVYKNKGWISSGDWLGTQIVATNSRKYKPFEKVREFVHKLQLSGENEWRLYCKGKLPQKGVKPDDIPSAVERVYKNEWISWPDFLGTKTPSRSESQFLSFPEARKFARSLNLSSQKEWMQYCKSGGKPSDIPATPSKTYKNEGWTSLGDWLGTDHKANQNRTWLPYKNAQKHVRQLKLNNFSDWKDYMKNNKLPDNIPKSPEHVYKENGWISWGDWLGTGRIADQNRKYRLFKQARSFARQLKLSSESAWRSYCRGEIKDKEKLPKDIPSKPDRTYKNDGWIDWYDWLGKKIS